MNINSDIWAIQKNYVKNDIVKRSEISKKSEFGGVEVSIVGSSNTSSGTTLGQLNDLAIGLRRTSGYVAEAYVRLKNEFDESLDQAFLKLNDRRQTFLSEDQKSEVLNRVTNTGSTEGLGVLKLFDPDISSGIGFFVVYKNSKGELIDVQEKNLEDHYSLYSTSQIDHNQWSKIKFHITHDSAPKEAVSFNVYFCNYANVTLDAKDFKIKFSNPYFYCLKAHSSNGDTDPSLVSGMSYWSQDFTWRPAYGSVAGFSAKVDSMSMGDLNTYKALNHINGIECSFDLNFENLTEKEGKAIIHFLQHKAEVDDSFYDFNSSGDRKEHQISRFNYDLFFPYKPAQVFCERFNHSIKFDNLHNIQATFKVRESILNQVSSFNGYNERIDGKIILKLDSGQQRNGLFYFEFKEGENSIVTGSDGCISLEVRTGGCPVISKLDSNGENRKIILPNYRIIKLNENLSSSDYGIDYISDRDFTLYSLSSKIEIMLPSVCGNSSMFIKEPKDITFFSYLGIRDFKFSPSHSFEIPQEPNVKVAGIDQNYDPKYKFGINANNNFSLGLTFSQRNEEETKSILLFLESHLGHKSFRFSLPDPYGKGAKQRFFYCPEWKHKYIYKDNHTIDAKFIECINSQKEDLSLIENYLSYDPTV